MAYSTVSDLIKRYGEQDIILLTNPDIDSPTSINQMVVDEAIADADAEINLYLPARYKLPLVNIPIPLIKASCILAYANLHKKLPKDAPELEEADRQRAILKAISKGELTIGLTLDNDEIPLANTVQISEGRNDFKGNY